MRSASYENGIDVSVLPFLTDQIDDLERLGILPGHRDKLLHSIACLELVTPSSICRQRKGLVVPFS
jgi:hypothetical protein